MLSFTREYAKERAAIKVCRVCGDKAYSYNFNVITCESCKAFFRRNANKEKEIRCHFKNQCDINLVSRRFCQRCRLHKCYNVGMKKEWIMSKEARVMGNHERRQVDQHVVHPRHNLPRQHHSFMAASAQHSPVGPATAHIPQQHVMTTLLVQPSTAARPWLESFDSLPSPNAFMAAGFRPPSLTVLTIPQEDAVFSIPVVSFASPSTAATPFSTIGQQQALASNRFILAAQKAQGAAAAASQAQLEQKAQLRQRFQQQLQQQQVPQVQLQLPMPTASAEDQVTGELVTIPRNLLLKLVEGEQRQPRPRAAHADQRFDWCICTCLCGAYPPSTLITDANIAKLLSASAHERAIAQQNAVNLNLLRSTQLLQEQQQTLLQNNTDAASAAAAAATASLFQDSINLFAF